MLNSQLALGAKTPAPEEIVSPVSRFKVVTDREIEEMREWMIGHKLNLDLTQRQKYIADLARWLDEDKLRIAQQWDEIEKWR